LSIVLALSRGGAAYIVHCPPPVEGGRSVHCLRSPRRHPPPPPTHPHHPPPPPYFKIYFLVRCTRTTHGGHKDHARRTQCLALCSFYCVRTRSQAHTHGGHKDHARRTQGPRTADTRTTHGGHKDHARQTQAHTTHPRTADTRTTFLLCFWFWFWVFGFCSAFKLYFVYVCVYVGMYCILILEASVQLHVTPPPLGCTPRGGGGGDHMDSFALPCICIWPTGIESNTPEAWNRKQHAGSLE